MRNFDFYEFTGVLAPGVVTVYGIARVYPETGILTSNEKVSFGELSLMLVLAYVAGHLVQSFGNVMESIWWKCVGGWPSDWVRTRKHHILSPGQFATIPGQIRTLLKLECPENLSQIDRKDWMSITRQIYAVVRKAGRAERVDIFNGNYGMFRGISASMIVILFVSATEANDFSWNICRLIWIATLLSLLRMQRFGVHYSRELFVQFLSTQPGDTIQPKKE